MSMQIQGRSFGQLMEVDANGNALASIIQQVQPIAANSSTANINNAASLHRHQRFDLGRRCHPGLVLREPAGHDPGSAVDHRPRRRLGCDRQLHRSGQHGRQSNVPGDGRQLPRRGDEQQRQRHDQPAARHRHRADLRSPAALPDSARQPQGRGGREFDHQTGAPITLRGVAECLAVNFNGAAVPAGLNLLITIYWTEELGG